MNEPARSQPVALSENIRSAPDPTPTPLVPINNANLPSYYRYDPHAKVDELCLQQAWRFIDITLACAIEQCAISARIPVDVLEAFVCDRFISLQTGLPPTPTEWLVEDAYGGRLGDTPDEDLGRGPTE